MPEPVELGVRRGERRRVAVAEAHDRDAREQIQVAAARVVLQPRALSGHEGDAEPGVGGEQPALGGEDVAHAITAVAPMCAVIPLAAAIAAARSLGTIPPSNAPASSRRFASPARIASTIASST